MAAAETLNEVVAGILLPTEGNILIDNYDIDKVELYSLRRQIRIVPQEPLLFTGGVSDNIALTDPNASSEEIAKAADIACAHEFIMGLHSGYSTELGDAVRPIWWTTSTNRYHWNTTTQNSW